MTSPSPLDDSPPVSQVGLALQSLLFAVLFGTGLMSLGLWGVRTIQLGGPAERAEGELGPGGILLFVITIGGPVVAAIAAYALMAPIKSYYRRGGLAIVAGFATVAAVLISTVPIDHSIGRGGLLGLSGACGLI
ncbi:MAG TPA: hypothetical protein VMJ30_06505, partial [Gemmatimonadales bacterium]|nr:hypothetical protein [Gemmatimonadales bacterium]